MGIYSTEFLQKNIYVLSFYMRKGVLHFYRISTREKKYYVSTQKGVKNKHTGFYIKIYVIGGYTRNLQRYRF